MGNIFESEPKPELSKVDKLIYNNDSNSSDNVTSDMHFGSKKTRRKSIDKKTHRKKILCSDCKKKKKFKI